MLGVGVNYPQHLAQALRIIYTVCASGSVISMVPSAAWACLKKSMGQTQARATLRDFASSYTGCETTLDSLTTLLDDEVADDTHGSPNIWRKAVYQTLSRCRGVVRLQYCVHHCCAACFLPTRRSPTHVMIVCALQSGKGVREPLPTNIVEAVRILAPNPSGKEYVGFHAKSSNTIPKHDNRASNQPPIPTKEDTSAHGMCDPLSFSDTIIAEAS